MPIYTIANYRVKASGVDKVKSAIEEFVPYVRDHEPGTRLYEAWQQEDDPTRFAHFFIFEDEASHAAHSKSAAVKRFEAAYRPELVGGDVTFTDYRRIATNQSDSAGEILRSYYAAAIKRDFDACKRHLADKLVFCGLFRTYQSADEYLGDFKQLLQITSRLEVKSIVAQGADAVILFELRPRLPQPQLRSSPNGTTSRTERFRMFSRYLTAARSKRCSPALAQPSSRAPRSEPRIMPDILHKVEASE